MKVLEKIFKSNTKPNLKLRFSKSEKTWQVYMESRIVYVGEKESCINFMDHQVFLSRN